MFKRKTLLFVVFGLVFLSVLSCTKDETPVQTSENETIYLELQGEFADFQEPSKASAEPNIRLKWANGDVVYVYEGATCLGSLTATIETSEGYMALLSGTINAPESSTPTLSFVYSNLLSGEPTVTDGKIKFDFSSQNSSDMPFVVYGKKAFESITTTITDVKVQFYFASSFVKVAVYGLEENTAIDKAELSGINTECVLTMGDNGAVTVGGASVGTIAKTLSNWNASATGQAFVNMGIPASNASATRALTMIQNTNVYKKTSLANVVLPARNINTITGVKKVDVFPGQFSVSPTKKVRFTKKGNLYWDGSQWKMEAKQYDYPAAWDANHVSLMYWTKTASASYAEAYSDGTCTANDKFFCDGSDSDHMLTVGDMTGLYTLSIDEWTYLLNTDGSAAVRDGKIKKNVSVAGKAGCLVIAPDDFSGSIAASYTADEWAAAENNGLICLPPAGSRNGNVFDTTTQGMGYYWSSTPYASAVTKSNFFLYFGPFVYSSSQDRSVGSAIRLVTD